MQRAKAAGANGGGGEGKRSVTDEALVVFTPSGRRGRFPIGTPVLKAARSLGVDIDSVCGGRGLCGRCQIQVGEGEFAKHGITSRAENVSDWNEVEDRYHNKKGIKDGRRLSCQARVERDVLIDVPADSQVHKQVVRKRAEARDIELDPAVRLHFVEVEEPDMHNPTGDLERLEAALEKQWGLTGLECDLRILQTLQQALRAGKWQVTVAVHRSQVDHHAIWPGFHDKAYGMAVDVGSTTVAAHLCDLASGEVLASAGIMNPQIRFGEDLMSRVSYVMMNPGGDVEMTAAVREAINTLAEEVAREAGIQRDEILNATFVGNPVMHHLLLGIDPTELGGAPFALAANSGMTLWANQLDLKLHPEARVYVLPCIAGHVGADTAGVILSESPHQREEMTLVVDVGTNAEIVLGNKARLLGLFFADRPRLRGRADLLRPAGRARRHRARADRPGDAGAALPGDRLRSLVGRRGLCRGHQENRRHRHLRLGHHRGAGRDVPGRSDPDRRHYRRRHGGTDSSRIRPMAAPFPTWCTTASRRSASCKTMCGPSSSARPRSMPACAC